MEKNKAAVIKKSNAITKTLADIKKYPQLYIMILPVIVFYILFSYRPMYGVLMAFQDFVPLKGIAGSDFVGFKHFITFFNDIYFGRILKNTVIISFASIIFCFPVPIIFALLLNEIKNKYIVKPVQTISYMPHFISMVVFCGIIRDFTKDTGIITQMLSKIGIETGTMLSKPSLFLPIYLISDIWKDAGWNAIIYMAALAGVDQQLYDAAKVDGAGRWHQLWHVTISSIMPTIVIMLIMRLGSVLNVGFEKILLLYNPGIYETSDVISTYVYRKGLQEFNYGYSTAVNLFNSVISFIMLIAANQISKKTTEYALW
ncbi:MAG: sugar ABC transporter permease [Clostridia bacterium]|nr:sugar ABC transporter permease [Clostridia bacterium]